MAKPVILAVDDELQVLNAIERDLRRQFGSNFRIIKAVSGQEALETVHQLKRRQTPLALFLVDQRMPDMSGTEFLLQARELYPDARKILLTAYADTQAAITSINTIGLNYYLLKPWDPPELNLYPILEDQLSDWAASAQVPYEGIRVLGTLWSPTSHQVKDFLARNQVPYQYLDIERNPEGKRLAASFHDEADTRLPIIILPDGSYLINPLPLELAEKIGLQTQATQPFYDVAIIGGGPAGLAAAVYAGSEGLKTVLIEKEAPGGQAGTSSRIDNYLGFPNGLSGADLARRATVQAKRFGVEIITAQEVTCLRIEEPNRLICLSDGAQISCRTIVISTGVTVQKPDIPGMDSLIGAGVYFGAAFTEAANYRGDDVFTVGGGNSAGQGAVFLSGYAKTVTMLVRGSSLTASMSQYLIEQIEATQNIRVEFNSEIVAVSGNGRLESATILNRSTNETGTLPASAVFYFIGAVPHTDLVKDLVERDNAGFVLTGPDLMLQGKRLKSWTIKRDPFLLETSVPGIFAAGDVRHSSLKRVASAVGEGAIAVQLIHQYLKTV